MRDVRPFTQRQVFLLTVAKSYASRSQQNISTLQHEQRSPVERRQLWTRSVAKLATLYCWLSAARWRRGEVLLWPWSTQFGDSHYGYTMHNSRSHCAFRSLIDDLVASKYRLQLNMMSKGILKYRKIKLFMNCAWQNPVRWRLHS